VVDWTGYAKRDIIKAQVSDEIKDFTQASQSSSTPVADVSALGFLGNLASASESSASYSHLQ